MSEGGKKGEAKARRERVTVTLPSDLHGKLLEFCRDKKLSPDLVVERALADYFREGEMSH